MNNENVSFTNKVISRFRRKKKRKIPSTMRRNGLINANIIENIRKRRENPLLKALNKIKKYIK